MTWSRRDRKCCSRWSIKEIRLRPLSQRFTRVDVCWGKWWMKTIS